ncbi:hypothetical protein LCGC14_3037500 [marine sediment metagenome]|uniref:Uncharacterized protein n=1 Tax=marine sediment metagenome TaxID=412755 RepID=A0A0F8ZGI6_9ZZZZ
MKEIKLKDINIGDFIYLNSNLVNVRKYIIKINSKTKKYLRFKWWKLEDKTKERLFEPNSTYFSGDDYVDLDKGIPKEEYEMYKLNKKEVSKFNKFLILKNL